MDANRDANRVTTTLGVSSTDGETPIEIQVNPVSGAALVELTDSSGSPLNTSGGNLMVNVSNFAEGTFGDEDNVATNLNSALLYGAGFFYNPMTDKWQRWRGETQMRWKTNNIDVASATVTYVGCEDDLGGWEVQKLDTSSGNAVTYATIINNASVTTYANAWTGRAGLTYGTAATAF